MTQIVSEVTKIRRKVLKEVASLLFKNTLLDEIDFLPKKLITEGLTRYRCCQHKEKAILRERIKLALGVDPANYEEEVTLKEIAEEVLTDDGHRVKPPYISIIEEACDQCSIEKIVVTNACRNCVAHNCVNTCPRGAITIVDNQTFIIKEKCIECGLCVKACSYGAIIEIERPCNRSCSVNGIIPGEKSTVQIDYDNCLECGACAVACPFGAISFKSEIVNVYKLLTNPDNRVVAMLAPAFIGQFGIKIDEEVITMGLKKLGFSEVFLVAEGADEVIKEEGAELKEKLHDDKGIMFNSCCPSFKGLVEKHYPELMKFVSATESPMIKTAKIARADEKIKTVFIGPCITKKVEAYQEDQQIIDAVLTFEELTALLVGAGINLARIQETVSKPEFNAFSSWEAKNFCRSGGVGEAIKIGTGLSGLKIETANGLGECIKALNKVKVGVLKADFLEGMGCQNGCIGGPGTIIKPQVALGLLAKKG